MAKRLNMECAFENAMCLGDLGEVLFGPELIDEYNIRERWDRYNDMVSKYDVQRLCDDIHTKKLQFARSFLRHASMLCVEATPDSETDTRGMLNFYCACFDTIVDTPPEYSALLKFFLSVNGKLTLKRVIENQP